MRRNPLVFALALIVLGAGVWLSHGAITDPTQLGLPAMVVKDSTGNVVGQAVGFDGTRPLVPIRDDGNFVLLRVEPARLVPLQRVWYTGLGCSGTAHLEAPTALSAPGIEQMQGVVYGGASGNVLWRSLAVPPTNTTMESSWIAVNPPSGNCNDASKTADFIPGEMVADLDEVFPGPYTVE